MMVDKWYFNKTKKDDDLLQKKCEQMPSVKKKKRNVSNNLRRVTIVEDASTIN